MPSQTNGRASGSLGRAQRRSNGGAGDGVSAPARRPRETGSWRAPDGASPSQEPDVFVDIPKVHVGEIYFDVDRVDAHLSLRANLANLVQVSAGVQVHVGNVQLGVKDVDAEAVLKVRLENLYDLLDRALTSIDQNPGILEGLLSTVGTAVGDAGSAVGDVDGAAGQVLGSGGALGALADDVGQVLGPGGVTTDAASLAGRLAQKRETRDPAADLGDVDGGTRQNAGSRRAVHKRDTRRGGASARPKHAAAANGGAKRAAAANGRAKSTSGALGP
jgi:hypothetical protein